MELTLEQLNVVRTALDRYKAGEKYVVISGVAGSGKSTCVKFIISALTSLGIHPEEDVVFTSFTGKATLVLANKGNKNTSTLHKLLYKSRPDPIRPNVYINQPISVGELPYKIVVVDEIGMVPLHLMQLLAQHPCFVICLGDHNQLPPVRKDEDNHLLDHPHAVLNEVHRQAADSEILQVATTVRKGGVLTPFRGKDVIILPRKELTTGILEWADQAICATNATRESLNQQIRALQGRYGDPQDGDKVICNRNYWNIEDSQENALVNGTIGYLKNPYELTNRLPKDIIPTKGYKRSFKVVHTDFVTEMGGRLDGIEMDKQIILGGNPCIDWRTQIKLNKRKGRDGQPLPSIIPLEFSYANVISCHRAQGSEWDKVAVVEERFPFSRDEHRRWLYTSITRASQKLVVVLKD